MARIRSVHHEVALDDRLAECSWPARLAVLLLPTIADRDGRLRDNPKQIKPQLFPYDDGLDLNAVFDELVAVGRLERYSVDGERFIQLANWKDQQRPHMREAESTIPAIPGKVGAEHQPRVVQGTDLSGAEPVGLRSLVLGLGHGQGEGEGAPPRVSTTPEKIAEKTPADLATAFLTQWPAIFADVMACPWSEDPARMRADLERLFATRSDVARVLAVAREHLRTANRKDAAYPFDDVGLRNILRVLSETERRCVLLGILPPLDASGQPERTWKDHCADRGHHPICSSLMACASRVAREQHEADYRQEVEAAGGEDALKAKRREMWDRARQQRTSETRLTADATPKQVELQQRAPPVPIIRETTSRGRLV